ncbi:MAG: 6-pyruvoyl-tetrahydropterin synthase-related protein [Anaerolineae bacterium]
MAWREHRWDFGLLVATLIGLFAGVPLLRPGLPSLADAPVHLLRAREFGLLLQSGVFPARWAPHLAFGYGYPLFVFSPPLPYLLALASSWLGLGLVAAIKAVALAAMILGSIGAYLWARDAFDSRAGIIAAFAFSFAPLPLREAYLLGGNYPQLLAISLLPLLLWALRRCLLKGDGLAVAICALSLGGALLSHLFQGFVAAAVALGYLLATGLVSARQRLWRGILGLTLGTLLGSYIWLPALLERHWTHAESSYYLTHSPYEGRFLPWRELLALPRAPEPGVANPYLAMTLNGLLVFLAALGLAAVLWRGRRGRRLALLAEANYLAAVVAIAAFLNLEQSQALWRAVPALAVAQYPWRWLGIAGACLPWLAGAVTLLLPERAGHSWLAGAVTVAVSVLIVATSLPLLAPLRPYLQHGSGVADLYRYELMTGAVGTTTLSEYLPRWVEEPLAPETHAAELLAGKWPEPLPDSLGVEAELISLWPAAVSYQLVSNQERWLKLSWLYYPGWQAWVDGEEEAVGVEAGSGFLLVRVPPGEHVLSLRFGETPARLAGDWLCLLGLVGMAASFFLIKTKGVLPSPFGRGAGGEVSSFRQPHALLAIVLTLIVAGRLLWPSGTDRAAAKLSLPSRLAAARQGPEGMLAGAARVEKFLAPEQARAGASLPVTLYWRASASLDVDYATFVHLDSPSGQQTVAGSDNWPPGDKRTQEDMPTYSWPGDALVRDEHLLHLPASLPPGLYHLRAGLYEHESGLRAAAVGEGAGDGTVELALVRVLPRRPVRAGDVEFRLEQRVGSLNLLGYSMEPDQPGGGDVVRLTLYWQRLSSEVGDGHVFMHFAAADGKPVAQADGPFASGNYPPGDWLAGEIVADERVLAIPEDLPSGEYMLLAGVYDPTTLTRWPVQPEASTVENAVLLARVTIH